MVIYKMEKHLVYRICVISLHHSNIFVDGTVELRGWLLPSYFGLRCVQNVVGNKKPIHLIWCFGR